MTTEPDATPPGLAIPAELVSYLAARDHERDERVTRALEALTPTQRALIQEAAVMGYVLGARGREIPPDSAVLRAVVARCLDMPDLYPTISGEAPVSDPPTPSTGSSALHAQLTEAGAQWVRMYPFANWGFWGCAGPDAREQLTAIADGIAAGWGETIADAVMGVLGDHEQQIRAENAEEIRALKRERDDLLAKWEILAERTLVASALVDEADPDVDAELAPRRSELLRKVLAGEAGRDDLLAALVPRLAEAERARATETEATVERMRSLIDSYPPGSDFAQSGAQALFRRMLDHPDGQARETR